MSCDFAVWSPEPRLSETEASAIYQELCEGLREGLAARLSACPELDAFYAELTAKHPEIDSIAEDQIDDHDLCPWSCALEHTDTHIIMNCVWSKAECVGTLVRELAARHRLAVFDPQTARIHYPNSVPKARAKPWWRLW